ncbi:MAG: isftu1, partial [Verrucomicrobiales bacterium]|nr:isftu1 [Verrucomicrobiales bacterium]
MINPGPATRVFLAVGPTDLRKGFDGLSDLVRNKFKEDPLSGHMFVFANRNKTR